MRRSATAGLVLLTLVAFVPATAAARAKHRIDVHPGPDAITKALNRVEDGGVLRVHRGRYREAVTIDKQVKVVGVGKRRPVIDAQCVEPSTIQISADGVRLRRLKVIGANVANEVDFSFVSGGRVKDLVLKDTCDAEYGVNVFSTGPLSIVDSRATGFHDAGFYIGEITATPGGFIVLKNSDAYGNHRGVIVENSAGGDIRVIGNLAHDNDVPAFSAGPVGILLNNADGVLIRGNKARRNAAFGLQLTNGSDANTVDDNVFLDNPVDVSDDGVGNCGSQNTFQTGDALPPC